MTTLIGTSWKMNLTSTEADAWFRSFVPLVAGIAGCELFVLPPFTAIWVARVHLAGTGIAWGAQDVHPDEEGAHTGDVSASMLADLGCSFVEVGHSERRREHRETPDLIAAKVAAAVHAGMRPILCVGERTPGPLDDVVAGLLDDLGQSLARLGPPDADRVVIAYEPVWAIGEGATAAPPDRVGQVHRALADRLADRWPGVRVPIIYGGSVDAGSASALAAEPGVDGLFVGRRALDPSEFARIAWAGVTARTGGAR